MSHTISDLGYFTELLPTWEYLPHSRRVCKATAVCPPLNGRKGWLEACKKSESMLRMQLGSELGYEIVSLPPKISFSHYSLGHRCGLAHVQIAMDGYRKPLSFKRFFNCPISSLKQMETGRKGEIDCRREPMLSVLLNVLSHVDHSGWMCISFKTSIYPGCRGY